MEKRYQSMFDQALKQLEPSEDKVNQVRQTLADHWESAQAEKSRGVPGRQRHIVRRVALVAAVVALVTVTMAAAVIANGTRRAVITAVSPYEFGLAYNSEEELGVFEQNRRYYLQVETVSEPIDITGQFSDTEPYVYTYHFSESEDNPYVPDRIDYVIGRTGERIHCVLVSFDKPGDDTMGGSFTSGAKGAPRITDSPVWWRTYVYEHRGNDMRWGALDGWDVTTANFADHTWMQSFRFVTDGVTVEEGNGAVTLRVKGEERDITDVLKDGVYQLSVKGEENVILDYDESLWLGYGFEFSTEDYEDTFVYGPYDHTVLVCRDGDEVRWAEFIYRADGSLRFWMPWNCPTADDLAWLEDYVAERGFEMDWLLTHVSEKRSIR